MAERRGENSCWNGMRKLRKEEEVSGVATARSMRRHGCARASTFVFEPRFSKFGRIMRLSSKLIRIDNFIPFDDFHLLSSINFQRVEINGKLVKRIVGSE